MKNQLLKTVLFSLVAAALVTLPVVSHAQDSTNTPADTAPAKPKKIPFHGKAAAVDTAAMTITVGTMVINVTSETKTSKNGKPATLSDIVVGDMVSGSYVKGADGKLSASSLHDGLKAKKKKSTESTTSTNAPAAN